MRNRFNKSSATNALQGYAIPEIDKYEYDNSLITSSLIRRQPTIPWRGQTGPPSNL